MQVGAVQAKWKRLEEHEAHKIDSRNKSCRGAIPSNPWVQGQVKVPLRTSHRGRVSHTPWEGNCSAGPDAKRQGPPEEEREVFGFAHVRTTWGGGGSEGKEDEKMSWFRQ